MNPCHEFCLNRSVKLFIWSLNSWLKCFVYILKDLSWYLCSVLSWRQLTALWACESQHSQSLLFTYLIRSKWFPTIEDDQIYIQWVSSTWGLHSLPSQKRKREWVNKDLQHITVLLWDKKHLQWPPDVEGIIFT